MSYAVKVLMERVMSVVLDKRNFAPEDVYWVAGNHDGPEDSTFAHEAVMKESVAWAQVLVSVGVVDNKLGRRYTETLH
jgi:predicted phosphodiesterase